MATSAPVVPPAAVRPRGPSTRARVQQQQQRPLTEEQLGAMPEKARKFARDMQEGLEQFAGASGPLANLADKLHLSKPKARLVLAAAHLAQTQRALFVFRFGVEIAIAFVVAGLLGGIVALHGLDWKTGVLVASVVSFGLFVVLVDIVLYMAVLNTADTLKATAHYHVLARFLFLFFTDDLDGYSGLTD